MKGLLNTEHYMQIKTSINAISNQKIDRKEFIKHIALGVVILRGAGRALLPLSGSQKNPRSAGYGGSAYGGSEGHR